MTGLLPLAEAQARLLGLATPLPAEQADLRASLGRYLAAPLIARRNQPAAPLSAMDGYAIRWDERPGPWRLIGESAAGAPFAGTMPTGSCVRVSTGAIVPDGADTILVQEDAGQQDADPGLIRMTGEGPPAPAAHIRAIGSDFAAEVPLAAAGTRIDARLLALAAMAGHAALPVHGQPLVGLLSTGDELISPGITLPSLAHIPASNGPMLDAMVAEAGGKVSESALVGDDQAEIAATLERLAASSSVVVSTGGASVGDHDLVRPALLDLGAAIDYWRIAMKPGKPVMVARLGEAIILGLPGNPVSAYVTGRMLLLPLLRHLAGDPAPLPVARRARLGDPIGPGGSRLEFVRARIENERLFPLAMQDSAGLRTLFEANALIERPAHAPATPAGEWVSYHPL